MARIAVTDGMDKSAIAILEKAGHDVSIGYIEEDDLLNGALKEFDAIIVRSATKLPSDVIEVSQGLSVICLLYTSPSPRDGLLSRMPSSA